MSRTAVSNPAGAAAAGAGQASAQSLTDLVAGVWRSVLAEVGGTFDLVATEGRLAALSLAAMLGLALASVAFVLATWLAIAAALTLWLVSLGLAPALVLLGVAAGNLLLAWLAWLAIRALSRNLMFRRTRLRLQTRDEAAAPSVKSEMHAVADPSRA